jgi:hypothetical protein
MTQTAQHTPAPWTLDTPEPDGEIIVMDEQGVSIATCWKQPLDPSEWVEANAQLIAAAPELLDALESTLHCVEYYHEHEGASETLTECRRAIAKARGE